MEIFGHVISMYAALRRQKVTPMEARELLEEHAAKLCLTDAIRFTVRGEDVVQFGRGYSHFTDGCYMILPFGKELKSFTNIEQTAYGTGEGYRNKFADKPTDFALFVRMNPGMFEPENEDWGVMVLSHLHQDVNSDSVWQKQLCVCDTDNDKVVYPCTGRVVDGKKFREDMALCNIYMHWMFVEYVHQIIGDDLTDDDLLSPVRRSFEKWYTPEMAANTCRYINMDKRVFEPGEGEIEALAEEIIATGLVKSEEQLQAGAIKLFEDSIVSLNMVINHLVRMK